MDVLNSDCRYPWSGYFEMSADGYVTQEYTVQVNSFNSREFYLDREPVVEDLKLLWVKRHQYLPKYLRLHHQALRREW